MATKRDLCSCRDNRASRQCLQPPSSSRLKALLASSRIATYLIDRRHCKFQNAPSTEKFEISNDPYDLERTGWVGGNRRCTMKADRNPSRSRMSVPITEPPPRLFYSMSRCEIRDVVALVAYLD